MTYPPQPPPYQPGPDQPQGPEYRHTAPGWPPQPMPPAKRGGPGRVVLFVVLGVVGLFCAILGLGAILSDDEPKTRAESAAAATGTTPVVAVPELATPTPLGYEPKPSDFKLTAKITDKECFGSAGCNVSFRVDVDYSGLPLGESVTWLVIYEINGVEDAPEVGNLKLTGERFTSEEESVGTTSSKSKITLKVTSVEKG